MQVYGDGAAQFLTAGGGVLHEEMSVSEPARTIGPTNQPMNRTVGPSLQTMMFHTYNTPPQFHPHRWEFEGSGLYQDIELFQIWVNLPRTRKAMAPSIQLAGACSSSKGPIPTITTAGSGGGAAAATTTTTVRVIMGEAEGTKSPIEPWTPMSVLHVTCAAGARWEFPLPASHSLTLYVRRGPVDVMTGAGKAVRLKMYETAFCKVGQSRSDGWFGPVI